MRPKRKVVVCGNSTQYTLSLTLSTDETLLLCFDSARKQTKLKEHEKERKERKKRKKERKTEAAMMMWKRIGHSLAGCANHSQWRCLWKQAHQSPAQAQCDPQDPLHPARERMQRAIETAGPCPSSHERVQRRVASRCCACVVASRRAAQRRQKNFAGTRGNCRCVPVCSPPHPGVADKPHRHQHHCRCHAGCCCPGTPPLL